MLSCIANAGSPGKLAALSAMSETNSMASAGAKLGRLQSAVQSGDYSAATAVLTELKLTLLDFPALPPTLAASKHGNQELQIARDTFEAACLMNTKQNDMDAFAKNFAQLRPYYDVLSSRISKSADRPLILGINLMNLLVDNNLADFHTEMEMLTEEDKSSPLVAFPIDLEEHLLQGFFMKAASITSGALPSPLYAPFVEALQHTVRAEAADCIAASYPSMSLAAAAERLHFASTEQVIKYISAEQPTWAVQGDRVQFQVNSGRAAAGIPAQAVMHQALHYATELERIV